MLTPEALRAARGLLKWGVRDVAAAAGVSWTTVSQFENGRDVRLSTLNKIVAALEAEGVEVITTDEKTGATICIGRRASGNAH